MALSIVSTEIPSLKGTAEAVLKLEDRCLQYYLFWWGLWLTHRSAAIPQQKFNGLKRLGGFPTRDKSIAKKIQKTKQKERKNIQFMNSIFHSSWDSFKVYLELCSKRRQCCKVPFANWHTTVENRLGRYLQRPFTNTLNFFSQGGSWNNWMTAMFLG